MNDGGEGRIFFPCCQKKRKKIQGFHLAAVLVSLYNRAQQLICLVFFLKSEYFI